MNVVQNIKLILMVSLTAAVSAHAANDTKSEVNPKPAEVGCVEGVKKNAKALAKGVTQRVRGAYSSAKAKAGNCVQETKDQVKNAYDVVILEKDGVDKKMLARFVKAFGTIGGTAAGIFGLYVITNKVMQCIKSLVQDVDEEDVQAVKKMRRDKKRCITAECVVS